MPVNAIVRPGSLQDKKMSYQLFRRLCQAAGLQHGVLNFALVLDEYHGETDFFLTRFVLYNHRRIGRGFRFEMGENGVDCRMRLPTPCTSGDIADFYRFLWVVCSAFQVKTFSQDNHDNVPVSEMPAWEVRTTKWNAGQIAKTLLAEGDDTTIYAARYPIRPMVGFMNVLRETPEEAVPELYATYLHETQKGNYYYAKPAFFQEDDGSIVGTYALTEGVLSIIPLEPYIPSDSGLEPETPINQWLVALLTEQEEDFLPMLQLPFDVVKKKLAFERRMFFDRDHVIIRLSADAIAGLLDQQ